MFRILKRFSFPNFKLPKDKRIIWVHIPSVGEFNTVKPLLERIKNENTFLVLTYFSARAEGYLKKQTLPNVVLPLPFPFGGFIKKFNLLLRPNMFILVESDRFPELLNVKAEKKILVNARISDRSFKFLKLLKPIYRKAFNSFDKILCKSQNDYEKFAKLGIRKEKLTVCGNLKAVLKTDFGNLDINFPKGVKVITAGSTHKGEEEIILKIYKKIKKKFPNTVLVLAPRHIERVEEIENLIRKYSLEYQLRSYLKSKTFKGDVLLVDTLGELPKFYKVSDICIVGGTFIPLGGHNILEPAYFGKPVVYGPHIWKFPDLESILQEVGLGFKTEAGNLKEVLTELLENPPKPKKDLKEISERILDCYLRYTVDNPSSSQIVGC
jgi:3-deoxy-D-manno-octulosonic-acid transferase